KVSLALSLVCRFAPAPLNLPACSRDQCQIGISPVMLQRVPQVTHFSTDNIAPRDRIAAWRALIFQSSLDVEIAPADDMPFRATATVRQLPGLRILSGTSPAATYRRSMTNIEADDITLQFGSADYAAASLHRRETEIARYDAFLLPCGDRATIHAPQESRFVALRLPRAAIAQSIANLG